MSLLPRLMISPPVGAALYPRPDAAEYAETARRLAWFEGVGLNVRGLEVLSRYPIGFPLLLAPVSRMLGGDASLYPFLMALLGAVSVFLWGLAALWLVRDAGVACLAAALVAFSPEHIRYSHFLMSDVPALLVWQGLLLIALGRARKSTSIAEAISAGILCGILAAMRLSAAPLALAAGAGFLIRYRRGPGAIAAFLAAAALFPLAEAASRFVSFNSVFANGYAWWLPSHRAGSGFDPLSWHWLASSDGGQRPPNVVYLARLLSGFDGALIHGPLLVAVLAAMGLPRMWRAMRGLQPFIAIAVAGPILSLILQAFYFWQEARMILVWLPLMALLAATGVRVLAERLAALGPDGRRHGALVFLFIAAMVLSLPARAAWLAMHPAIDPVQPTMELRAAIERLAPEPPETLVVNFGVLAAQNLLYPGAPASQPRFIGLTDSPRHDDHLWRLDGVPVIAQAGDDGSLSLNTQTLSSIRKSALIAVAPDALSGQALDLWRAEPGWSLERAGTAEGVEIWRALRR